MRKSFTDAVVRQRFGEEKFVEVQIPFGLLESLEDVREGFFSLCVSAARQVLGAMMEQDGETRRGVEARRDRRQIEDLLVGGADATKCLDALAGDLVCDGRITLIRGG